MINKGYRIISLEANEIYKQEIENGVDKGFILPSKKDHAYFNLFKNVLDYSLDIVELEKCYSSLCRNKFYFQDDFENKYILAVINLKFTYTYKSSCGDVNLKGLRKHFYENGFNLDGVHYVRYKRSSGSSRQGKCLFINEKLYKHMAKWGECGLDFHNKDLASFEAYKSLSLSSIKGTIDIPLDGILFINDCKSEFIEEVISVEEQDGALVASTKEKVIVNDIWDGESLLDESLFQNYSDRHMLLLRNKFFKSCGFRTRLQKWFFDKNISLDDLKGRGFITLATDIKQIVMVTTPNSLKFLKFMKGGLTLSNIRKWMDRIDSTFGVVKYDKRTKFFDGRMVQASYQFINSLNFNEDDANDLLKPSKDYLSLLRNDYDFMRYHFSDAFKREADDEALDISIGLGERSNIIFDLMKINYGFKNTKLYINFRNDVIEAQKKKLRLGHILLSGTNATLFGNGPEMLMALAGEFDLNNRKNVSSVLNFGEIACWKFSNGEKMVCARSPHITMGNLYCALNNIANDIWDYFDLGENIVCVNALGENIQQRLNGCDYDSDTMLITNERLIVEKAFWQKDIFKVPVCNIEAKGNKEQELWELDHNTSENRIGEIVNLSQKLNSIIWDKLNEGIDYKEIKNIYEDVCKLAVLSGIEIDKAKRSYDSINVSKEIKSIENKYWVDKPLFFKEIDSIYAEQNNLDIKGREYSFYKAPMEFMFKSANEIDYRKGKEKKKEYSYIFDMLKVCERCSSTAYGQRDRVIRICEKYANIINLLYKNLRKSDEDERDLLYERIREVKEERKREIASILDDEYVLFLALKHYEKKNSDNWQIYAPLLECDLFKKILNESKEKMLRVIPMADGEYDLYGLKYTKK